MGICRSKYVVTDEFKEVISGFSLSKGQLAVIWSVFKIGDVSKDKKIDSNEFHVLFKERKSPYLEWLFLSNDLNHDGNIDFTEFVKMVSTYCLYTEEQLVNFCFNAFDQDGNGMIDEEEFREMMETIEKTSSDFPGATLRALKIFDANRDGYISPEEFQDMNLRFPHFLWPAFRLQYRVQEATLGMKGWKDQRKKMHKAEVKRLKKEEDARIKEEERRRKEAEKAARKPKKMFAFCPCVDDYDTDSDSDEEEEDEAAPPDATAKPIEEEVVVDEASRSARPSRKSGTVVPVRNASKREDLMDDDKLRRTRTNTGGSTGRHTRRSARDRSVRNRSVRERSTKGRDGRDSGDRRRRQTSNLRSHRSQSGKSVKGHRYKLPRTKKYLNDVSFDGYDDDMHRKHRPRRVKSGWVDDRDRDRKDKRRQDRRERYERERRGERSRRSRRRSYSHDDDFDHRRDGRRSGRLRRHESSQPGAASRSSRRHGR